MHSGDKLKERLQKLGAFAGVILFIVVAFEIIIMISPFAFFFYSVFNPIFGWLGQFAATRWLTSFFLPHMILPPTLFLKIVRVGGSVLFILGAILFITCALQVYLGKLFKWGIADKGLYRYIRHPQYLALGIWGIGMSILWPRFIVLAGLSLMFVLYYFLARDEERRMEGRYGEAYQNYMDRVGMFLPKPVEDYFSSAGRIITKAVPAYVAVPVLIIVAVMGSGFILRAVTLNSLSFATRDNLSIVSILPEDVGMGESAAAAIMDGKKEGKLELSSDQDYLAYMMPADYIMQGMIADTGGQFHLFKQHNTLAMISEWVLHPFEHLRASPALHMAKMHNVDPSIARRHHCPLEIDDPALDCGSCPYRRVIIDQVDTGGKHPAGSRLLAFSATRTPRYAVDLNVDSGEIVNIMPVEKATAWANVPTPSI